jgi:hypothetical protein
MVVFIFSLPPSLKETGSLDGANLTFIINCILYAFNLPYVSIHTRRSPFCIASLRHDIIHRS